MNKYGVSAALLSLSTAGLLLIAHSESGTAGPQLQAYKDPVGIPTICYGHIKAVKLGQTRSLKECEALLQEDASEAGRAVGKLVKVDLTQPQYDALVSFTFNLGAGNLAKSMLLKKLNAGDCRGAAREFLKWDHAGGKKLRGLTRRRQEESLLFSQGCEP